jgi:hypothetical protein
LQLLPSAIDTLRLVRLPWPSILGMPRLGLLALLGVDLMRLLRAMDM